MSMLEKAMATKAPRGGGRPVADEEIELVLAWLEGKLTIKQVSVAYDNKSHNSCVYRMLTVLKQAFVRNKIQLASQDNAINSDRGSAAVPGN